MTIHQTTAEIALTMAAPTASAMVCDVCQGNAEGEWTDAYGEVRWEYCQGCQGTGVIHHGEALVYSRTMVGAMPDDYRRFISAGEVSEDTRPEDADETFTPEWDTDCYGQTLILSAGVPVALLDRDASLSWVLAHATMVAGERTWSEYWEGITADGPHGEETALYVKFADRY